MKRLRWQILVVILALGAIAVLLFSQKPVINETVFEAPEPVAGSTPGCDLAAVGGTR